jgi:hypothetical protein
MLIDGQIGRIAPGKIYLLSPVNTCRICDEILLQVNHNTKIKEAEG